MTGLLLNKLIINWKYHNSKICLIHLTYLNTPRTLQLAYSWAESFIITLTLYWRLNISCNLWNTVLKVKKRMVVWVQNDCMYLDCPPSWLCAWLGAVTCCHYPASQMSVVSCISSHEEDQNSQYSLTEYVSL